MEQTKQEKEIYKKRDEEMTRRDAPEHREERFSLSLSLVLCFCALVFTAYCGEILHVHFADLTLCFGVLILYYLISAKIRSAIAEKRTDEHKKKRAERALTHDAVKAFICIIAFFYSESLENRPGVSIIYPDRTEILQPSADLPEEYWRIQYDDEGCYEGMSKEYTYGSGKNSHTERKRNGFGYCRWEPSGDYYMGNWEENHRTCGLYVWGQSGAAYFGDFVWNEDSSRHDITGRGIYCYSGGHSFDGHFKNGNREGWGYYYYHDGRRLYAEFKDNERIAYKELARKDCYVGWFKEREYTGYGRYYYAEGGFYQGWFKNGMFNGPGKVADAQNQIVADRRWKMADPEDVRARFLVKPADGTGNISDLPDSILVNTKYGPRLITFSRKDTLQRPKRSEDINAEDAFLTQPDPSARRIVRYKGRLVNKKPEGTAEATFENGDVYIGGWHNGLREGYGEIRYTNGEEYKGEWKADKRTGKGYYFKGPNDYVKGDFVDGHPHGLAIRYVNGVRIFNGRWENGQPTKKGIKANARGKTP